MKKPISYILVITAISIPAFILLSQPPAKTNPGRKSTAELIADIRNTDDDGTLARDAIKIAVQTKQLDVLVAGMSAKSYDARHDSIKALEAFTLNQKKAAIMTALRNDEVWKLEASGETAGAQMVYFRDLIAALKSFHIDAKADDLLNTEARHKIADGLAGLNTGSGK
jgi:hypothetical protein